MRTCATFESTAFNTTDQKPEFEHPDNFGDDVVTWLMEKLRARGIAVDETDPSQEDHGWYVTFGAAGATHDAIAIYAPTGTASRWLLCVERSYGILGSLFGRRIRNVQPNVLQLIDTILKESPEVRNVRWFDSEDVRTRKLEGGSLAPFE